MTRGASGTDRAGRRVGRRGRAKNFLGGGAGGVATRAELGAGLHGAGALGERIRAARGHLRGLGPGGRALLGEVFGNRPLLIGPGEGRVVVNFEGAGWRDLARRRPPNALPARPALPLLFWG